MTKYHISTRLIHWTMAAIILSALGLGIYMTEFLSKDATNRMDIYGLHKSLGVMALIFIALRIFNRIFHPNPKMLESLSAPEKFAVHFVHYLLYVLMIAVPLSGYLMSNSFGFPVHLFSYEMPVLLATNYDLGKIFSEIHELGAYTLIGALALHILGALKHKFFDKPENDVFKRMI